MVGCALPKFTGYIYQLGATTKMMFSLLQCEIVRRVARMRHYGCCHIFHCESLYCTRMYYIKYEENDRNLSKCTHCEVSIEY